MLWSALQIALLVYLGLAALIYFKQSSLVFLPEMDRGFRANPADIGLPFTPLQLATTDGETLDSWFVPANTKRETRGLVIFLHGNAGNIGHRLDYLRMFHDLGLATLIIDYRGYGRSSGAPSEDGTYLDAAAAWRHATLLLGFPADRIVLFGESLGGSVAAQLAAGNRPAALVLASTFTSVPDLGAEIYPMLPIRLLAHIRYDTLARLPQITCPILVIHSRNDDIIPFAHGRRLFEAAGQPKQFLEMDGGHNEGFVFGREAWVRQFDRFLQSALP
ncbi:MAG: alpha/beta hydrolase [Sulfuritalea sp.]|nr:alpha/beta hydrolase [Sulfuritalea sp.]